MRKSEVELTKDESGTTFERKSRLKRSLAIASECCFLKNKYDGAQVECWSVC